MSAEFTYMLNTEYDVPTFLEAMEKLEKIPNIRKIERLDDVDGGVYQIYALDDKRIVLKLSVYDNSVHINSDVDLAALCALG